MDLKELFQCLAPQENDSSLFELKAIEKDFKDLKAVEVENVIKHLPLNVEDKNLFD